MQQALNIPMVLTCDINMQVKKKEAWVKDEKPTLKVKLCGLISTAQISK